MGATPTAQQEHKDGKTHIVWVSRRDSDASSKTYFALNSGLMFQYYLSPKLALAFDGLATLVFSTKDIGSDTIWLFPLSAGLLFRF